jgi:PKD repeat protein
MNRLFLLLIGILFIFNMGCKKEIQVPDEEIPVFYFNGNINATPVNLQAGVNNYYMYSFFKQDSSNGLYAFFGNIKQVNCTNCTNHITFKIYDSKLSAIGGASHIDSTLTQGKYIYYGDTTLSAKRTIVFEANSSLGDTVQSYSWDFGDGTTSTLQNPTKEYSTGTYSVCLKIVYKDGCEGNNCNNIIVGSSNTDECNAVILDTALAGNAVVFNGITKTVNPVSYTWDFNDSASGSNNSSTLKHVVHDFTAPGIYKIYLQISTTGCSTVVSKYISTPNYTNGCFTNYTFTILPSNQLPFSKITIYWTDATGKMYSSMNVDQPADSYFEILSLDDYNLNENKQRTKKIHVRFKCLVSDGKSSITVTDADAMFAVAYR